MEQHSLWFSSATYRRQRNVPVRKSVWKGVGVSCRCSPDWQMKLRCSWQERVAHRWSSPTSMLPQGLEYWWGVELWDQWLNFMESPDIQNQILPIMYLPNTICRFYHCFSSHRWFVKNMKISCWRCSFRFKAQTEKHSHLKRNHFSEMFISGCGELSAKQPCVSAMQITGQGWLTSGLSYLQKYK